jgi:hypothetical protein
MTTGVPDIAAAIRLRRTIRNEKLLILDRLQNGPGQAGQAHVDSHP